MAPSTIRLRQAPGVTVDRRETGAGDVSIEWGSFIEPMRPWLPWLALLLLLLIVLMCPLPGRGPSLFASRDPWRTFKYGARRTVLDRAGNRCEGTLLLAWIRCRERAEEADHIYPWSRHGATVVSNGQALCRRHNRSKSAVIPPWWYVLSLEHRRRSYFQSGSDVRVMGGTTRAEMALHSRTTS